MLFYPLVCVVITVLLLIYSAYWAPEIIKRQPHDFGVDMWAFGVLVRMISAAFGQLKNAAHDSLFC